MTTVQPQTQQSNGGCDGGGGNEVYVHLECVCPYTHLGQSVYVVGSCASLGCWRLSHALQLHTNENAFPTWKTRGSVPLHRNKQVEFKFLIMTEDRHYVNWEPTGNRKLTVNSSAVYHAEFGQEHNFQVTTLPEPVSDRAHAAEPRPQAKWMGRSPDASTTSLQRLASFTNPQQQQVVGSFCWGGSAAAYGPRSCGVAAAAAAGAAGSGFETHGGGTAAAGGGGGGSHSSSSRHHHHRLLLREGEKGGGEMTSGGGRSSSSRTTSSAAAGRGRRNRIAVSSEEAAAAKDAAALPENGMRCWDYSFEQRHQSPPRQAEAAADAAAGEDSAAHHHHPSASSLRGRRVPHAAAKAAARGERRREGEEGEGGGRQADRGGGEGEGGGGSKEASEEESKTDDREGGEEEEEEAAGAAASAAETKKKSKRNDETGTHATAKAAAEGGDGDADAATGSRRRRRRGDRTSCAEEGGRKRQEGGEDNEPYDEEEESNEEEEEHEDGEGDEDEQEEEIFRATCSPALRVLVEGDRKAKSWREKMEVVRKVLLATGLKGEKCVKHSAEELLCLIDGLSYAAIYLRFVSLGDVPCVEDGRHFRPNYHALLSKELCVLLEQLMLDVNNRDDALGDAVRLLVRAVAPSLPSFHAAFTAAQPLTRIRDIAHRNDISPDLKNELKHSLQNKLHRCAGPEDLTTAQQFLERFHAHREAYPAAFIAEFEKFYDELCRFFNAAELETRLNEMRAQDNPRMNELITRFLEAKARMDDPTASVAKLLVTLTICLELRCALNYQLRDNVPVAADCEAAHQMQEMRLAEVLLDDVAFVLLSRIETLLTQLPDSRWAEAIEALALGVRDVKVSGLRRDECRALDAELALHACRVVQAREDWLVIKATLERVQRLAEDCTDLQLALFSGRAVALGRELQLPPRSGRLYSEAAVRSSIVFQISKMCTGLLRRVRLLLNLQPYDVLVPGEAAGVVLLCDTLEEGVLQCVRVNCSGATLSSSSSSIAAAAAATAWGEARRSEGGNSSSSRGEEGGGEQPSRDEIEKRGSAAAEEAAAAAGGGGGSSTAAGHELPAATDAAGAAAKERAGRGGGGAAGWDTKQSSAAGRGALLRSIILAARTASGDEELGGLDGPAWRVEGIVIGHDMPVLSHLGVRARQHAIPFVACEEVVAFDPLVAAEGKTVRLCADCVNVSLSVLEGPAADAALQQQEQRRLHHHQQQEQQQEQQQQEEHAAAASPERGGGAPAWRPSCSPGQPQHTRGHEQLQRRSSLYPFSSAAAATLRGEAEGSGCCLRCLSVEQITLENSGSKAATCAMLRGVAAAAQAAAAAEEPPPPLVFDAPNCMAFPFGTMEGLLRAQRREQKFQQLLEKLEQAPVDRELDAAAAEMQQLIMELTLPDQLLLPIHGVFGSRCRLVVRSSANTEDLPDFSAAGLYESVANVCVGDLLAFQSAVVTVWASLFSTRAVLARRAAGIPQHQACMAVLLQELINPELCFILHTANPLDAAESDFVYAEVAPGLGEILAGGKMRGSPYRLVVNKSTGELTMLAFCNYSHAVVPVMPRTKSFSTLRDGKKQSPASTVDPSSLVKMKVIDYTLEPMTQNEEYRMHVAHSLAEVGVALEEKLGGPQDVEGVISRDCVWVVQSRPQKITSAA